MIILFNLLLGIALGDVSAKYNGRDAIGDLLQEWIARWFDSQNYYYRQKPNTQEFPDFLLDETDNTGLLEMKTFNSDAGPAFDIANFAAYCNSLLLNPERLDADYLIIAYKMENAELSIKNVWLKKVWEIVGIPRISKKSNPISLQVKGNQIYNIRPITWYSKKPQSKPFSNKSDFLTAIAKTHLKYPIQTIGYSENWLLNVSNKYYEVTKTTINE